MFDTKSYNWALLATQKLISDMEHRWPHRLTVMLLHIAGMWLASGMDPDNIGNLATDLARLHQQQVALRDAANQIQH